MRRTIVFIALLLACTLSISAQAFKPVAPDQAGFSASRLARVDSVIDAHIQKQDIAGVISVIIRDGKAVHMKPYGMADVEAGKPMTTDAIFRIASMSKAATTIAVMTLYEEGRFMLNDPVSRYIPEFKESVVAVDAPAGSTARYVTVKPHQPITIRHLLTHSSGLTYGWGPAHETWKEAGFDGWYFQNRDEPIGASIRRLAGLPLMGQPGEVYQYGYSTDVLGYLVEVISGMPLDRYLSERVFKPLKMNDTGFYVDPSKVNRFLPVYGIRDGKLTKVEAPETSDFVVGPRKSFSGGAGLTSTATDYARMLQMLLNGGTLDGVRILSPKTVDLMTSNHLGDLYNGGREGFGLGFWTSERVGNTGELTTEGAYGWGSAYYPIYWVDPKEKMIGIFLTQLMPAGTLDLSRRYQNLVYQAVVDSYVK